MRGGFARAYTPADHPVVAFRRAVGAAAMRKMTKAEWQRRLGGLRVRIQVWCCFVRPPSHLLASGLPRKDAPLMPRPDTDNLVKAVMDALTDAGVWDDDTVVVNEGCRKRYVSARVGAHTVVRVR